MNVARSASGRSNIRGVARTLLFACAMLLARQAGAADDLSSRPGEASIPFANHGGIFDWRSDGTRGIWVQAATGKWFYGTFVSACLGLEAADRVGFVTNPSGDFDHWSAVLVRHEVPCHLASFTTSEAPPDHRRDTASAAGIDSGNRSAG